MKTIVIGGTGHIGTYLIPRLVEAGHRVICINRGQKQTYQFHAAWNEVEMVQADRVEEEKSGAFAERVAGLNPDIVIDLICFNVRSARALVEKLGGRIQHFLHCGTIWVHGPSIQVPTTEEQPRRPFGEYGILKADIEAYLLQEARLHHFPVSILHPGHIVGPGWWPLNPAGNFNASVFLNLSKGKPVQIPNIGMETVHHVHADDVAQAFMQALANRSVSIGESFHVVSPGAVSLRGYAETVAGWFGQKANLQFLAWEKFKATVTEEEADITWDHIAHSPNCSIEKARRLLYYRPRYTSFQAVKESLDYLIEQDQFQA